MSLVRRALPEDATEVLRLRQVIIDSVFGVGGGPTDWHVDALPALRSRLAAQEGEFAAFVVDRPDRPGHWPRWRAGRWSTASGDP